MVSPEIVTVGDATPETVNTWDAKLPLTVMAPAPGPVMLLAGPARRDSTQRVGMGPAVTRSDTIHTITPATNDSALMYSGLSV